MGHDALTLDGRYRPPYQGFPVPSMILPLRMMVSVGSEAGWAMADEARQQATASSGTGVRNGSEVHAGQLKPAVLKVLPQSYLPQSYQRELRGHRV